MSGQVILDKVMSLILGSEQGLVVGEAYSEPSPAQCERNERQNNEPSIVAISGIDENGIDNMAVINMTQYWLNNTQYII